MNNKNNILEANKERFACKKFDIDKKISKEDFDFILETGRLSPSSFGWEPWKFLVVQDMELREKLRASTWGAQTQLPMASHFVLILARKAMDLKQGSDYLRHISEEVKRFPAEVIEARSDFFEKFKAHDFDLSDDRKLFDWSSKQTYIPLANMMTAAAYIGIDSCPIEGFDQRKIEAILKETGVVDTDKFGLSVMVAFGYRGAGVNIHPKTRQTTQEVIEWIK